MEIDTLIHGTWRHRHGGMDTWRNGENEDMETSNGK
jgi:hypothetical protein